jgi:hypothetical protein
MPGELVPRGRNNAQLQRATRGALSEVAARQLVVETIIRAKSQVGEFAANEAFYLKTVEQIAVAGNPAAANQISAIINMTIAGIIRTNSEFGGSL